MRFLSWKVCGFSGGKKKQRNKAVQHICMNKEVRCNQEHNNFVVMQHNAQQSRLVSHLVKGLSGSRACRAKYSQLRLEEMQVYCTGEECRLSPLLIYGKLVPMIHPCLFVQKWWVKVSTISCFRWHLICVQPRTLQSHSHDPDKSCAHYLDGHAWCTC